MKFSCLQMEGMLNERRKEIRVEMVKNIYYKYFRNFVFVNGKCSCDTSYCDISLVLDMNKTRYAIEISINYWEQDNKLTLSQYRVNAYSSRSCIYSFKNDSLLVCQKAQHEQFTQHMLSIVEQRESMSKHISEYHKKLYNTQLYNNLQCALTFLTISKYTIFPKDIIKLIYFRILFFVFFQNKKLKK